MKIKPQYGKVAQYMVLIGALGIQCGPNKEIAPQTGKEQDLTFLSPPDNSCWNYDTTAPFALLWQHDANKTIESLTLKITKKGTTQDDVSKIPLEFLIRETEGNKEVITMITKWTVGGMRYQPQGLEGYVKDNDTLSGDYEAEATLKTNDREYRAKVNYFIRE